MSNWSSYGRRRLVRLVGGLTLSLVPFVGVARAADEAPAARAAAAARPLNLQECLQIALSQQPALAAAQASLAAAEAQKRALDRLHAPPIIAAGRQLPYRRQQACLGVTIASAGLTLTEEETTYAVTRTYFSAVYAHQQQLVAEKVVSELKDALANAERLVRGGARFVTQNDVDKTKAYLRLAEGRQQDALRGAAIALAALREAMGVEPDYPLQIADNILPTTREQISRDEIITLALTHRGELVQATSAAQVARLEVKAQEESCMPTAHTFAAFVDIHVRPIPQGKSNGEYRPGAIGLEMPPMLVGMKADRVDRSRAFSDRTNAVVDKTRNLIALEAQDAFLKWQEGTAKAEKNGEAATLAEKLAKNLLNDLKANQAVVYRDVLEAVILGAQARVSYNEALFEHANALATLERVTGGAFHANFGTPAPGRPR